MKSEINYPWTPFENGICSNHSGKMQGMPSFSTSCTDNHFCKAYASNPNFVCSQCYAQTLSKQRTNLAKKNIRNGNLVKHRCMERSEIPFVNAAYFRLESFGDLETIQQCYNYFLFCNVNKHCKVALYTKNAFIVDMAMRYYDIKKPKNLIIVESSKRLNHAEAPSFPFVDHVFTVYTADYAEEHDIEIHCADRQCVHCLRCYSKHTKLYVNELLKKDQKKKRK